MSHTGSDSEYVAIRDNKLHMVYLSVFFCIGEVLYWLLPIGLDLVGIYVEYATAVATGVTLAWKRNADAPLLRDSIGVGLQVAVVWILLAATVESILTGDAEANVTGFPNIVIAHAIFIIIGFVFGARISGKIKKGENIALSITLIVTRVLKIIVSIVLIVITLALFGPSEVDEKKPPSSIPQVIERIDPSI
ncbi:MAG: hypothetical protein OXQ89_17005 [Rhodospirillaceae bacterium]|nr:hypothetical protein [Rhodospirillaceae bacterium]